ncbi:MAG: GNAT family N-acetyltransferase [Saprospiraceae bacterium]|nr:GNAT family N-acetyltransferase [Saprospiraceae bacterium]
MHIRKATLNDLKPLAMLFDDYRVFYKQQSDLSAAEAFLKGRISNNESVIFIAENDDCILGFTQLYPTFSSVSLESFYILNDLYVSTDSRGKGIGKAILNYCQNWVINHGYKGLSLETASDNPAQNLYEREGWSRDKGFYHYFWKNEK